MAKTARHGATYLEVGQKTKEATINAGFDVFDAAIPLRTYQSTTQVGNSAGVDTDAFSHTIAADTLSEDGQTITFKAAGTFAANTNTKKVEVLLGATSLFIANFATAASASHWSLTGTIIRTGSATQKVVVDWICSDSNLRASTKYTSTTADLTEDNTLKLVINGTGASDVVAEVFREVWNP